MGSDDVAKIGDLDVVFENIVKVVFELAGIVLFVLFLIGGLKYIIAGGDPQKIQGAKNTLTYAIGGLVVLILAYAIIFLIEEITGADVTNFSIIGKNP